MLSYRSEKTKLLDTTFRGGFSASFYDYDTYGRLISSTMPTGSKMSIRSHSDTKVLSIYMDVDDTEQETTSNFADEGGYGAIIEFSPGYIYDEVAVKKGMLIISADKDISVYNREDECVRGRKFTRWLERSLLFWVRDRP